MTEQYQSALAWVKAHKKQFIEKLIADSGVAPQDNPSAIFMAGLPGAGKTELSKNLIKVSGVPFVRIDMDEIASQIENYQPEEADKYRLAASTLLNVLFGYALKHQYNFIMDGTFGSKSAELNINRALKRNYNVQIIYVYQDPKLAWQFTLAREKIEHRSIKFEGFVDAYYNTLNNIKEIKNNYGNHITIDIAIKQVNNEVRKWIRDANLQDFDNKLNVEYNKNKLIKYIKGE